MKTLSRLLLVLLFFSNAYGENTLLAPGKYMMAAPAIYFPNDPTHPEWLCEVSIKDNVHEVLFLLHGDAALDLRVADDGTIKIVRSGLSESEMPRGAEGYGQITGENTAIGRVRVVSGIIYGAAIVTTSEWSLRPATEREIYDNMMRGLEMVADSLYHHHVKSTSDKDFLYCMYGGEGRGFAQGDIPKILKMIEDGVLVFKKGKFHYTKEVPPAVEVPLLISHEREEFKGPLDEIVAYLKDNLWTDDIGKIEDRPFGKGSASTAEEPKQKQPETATKDNVKPVKLKKRPPTLLLVIVGIAVLLCVAIILMRKRKK